MLGGVYPFLFKSHIPGRDHMVQGPEKDAASPGSEKVEYMSHDLIPPSCREFLCELDFEAATIAPLTDSVSSTIF